MSLNAEMMIHIKLRQALYERVDRPRVVVVEEVEVQPGSGGTRLILTACHWLTSRGGEAPRKIFFWFFTSVYFIIIIFFILLSFVSNCNGEKLQRSYLRFPELVWVIRWSI